VNLVVCCQPHLGWDQGLERSAVLAQGMAGKLMGSETRAAHSSVNSKNYVAMLSVVIKEFENMFQDCKKKKINFQMECINLQSDIHLKNLIMYLCQTLIIPIFASQSHLIYVIAFWQYAHL